MKNLINKWIDGAMLCFKIAAFALVFKLIITLGLHIFSAVCTSQHPAVSILITVLLSVLLIPLSVKKLWDLWRIKSKSN